MKRLARRRDQPRSRRARAWGIAFGTLMGAVTLFVVADHLFQIRESIVGREAYSRSTGEPDRDRRLEEAIRYRIAVLSRPRDTNAIIGGDPSARVVETALLYGRLALLQEGQGRQRESASSMAQAVSLLKSVGHPDPTEQHIRNAIARQSEATDRSK